MKSSDFCWLAGAVISWFKSRFLQALWTWTSWASGWLFLCPSKGTIMTHNRVKSLTALNQWRDVEIMNLCSLRSQPPLCKYYTCVLHLHVKTIIWPFIYKQVYFEFFMHFWLTWCLRLLNLYLVCLYITFEFTLQCWNVLSCLLFLSRLIYLRRLWLGNCQSNIFYIVIFAQLLLR